MPRPQAMFLALLCTLPACSTGVNDGVASGDASLGLAVEWQSLFDGSNLERWHAVGDANWAIVGDTVRADSRAGSGFLVSDADYGDFDLSLDFWVSDDANSGVFIRCMDRLKPGAASCYEVNIFDTRPDPTYRTGAIVNFAPPAEIVDTGGRWNHYEISARGNRLSARLNNIEMFDIEDSTFSSGLIALQYGSGIVIFRNVRIRTR